VIQHKNQFLGGEGVVAAAVVVVLLASITEAENCLTVISVLLHTEYQKPIF
jgi:hypothetical protein